MTTRADLNRLSAASKRASDTARSELEGFFVGLDVSNAEAVRDALLEFVPALVREYGDVAATAAAEWYEELRSDVTSRSFNARLAPLKPDAAVEASVRYSAGHLFDGDPADTLALLSGSVQRFVTYGSRATVARNVQLDPLKPRYGRVPSIGKSCAWCSMLASRGFVYHSERSAGGAGDDFHDRCRCQIVVDFDRDGSHIEGYDPDRLYDIYLRARDSSGATTDKAIAAEMRRLEPDLFKDGVHSHA